jgi:hypothetical protein
MPSPTRTPGVNQGNGFMNWFLNTKREALPHAPESAVTFRGAGNNIVYIDWENDLVVVVRWIRGGERAGQLHRSGDRKYFAARIDGAVTQEGFQWIDAIF